MAQLTTRLQNFLGSGSAAGKMISQTELNQLNPEELALFARQAIDAVQDIEVLKLLAQKLGPDQVPAPLNSLKDHAAGKAWVDGTLTLSPQATGAAKQAVHLLQRALVKIAVHHPLGSSIGALLQLPYAADGGLGNTTFAALNAAMQLANKPTLANQSASTPIGKDVAEALESLLKQTTPILHPGTVNPPPPTGGKKQVLFLGMGDFASHEANALKAALPPGFELVSIMDSKLGDDLIKIGAHTYDLKDSEGRDQFLNGAFSPALSGFQKGKVKAALEASAWGIADARDEIAELALAFHRSEASGGATQIPFLYVSGHSGSRDIWGDHNGSLPMEALQAIAEGFPTAAGTVKAPFFAACNHLHQRHVTDECAKWFPNMEYAGGYYRYAPGTFVGGAAQAVAYLKAVHKKMKGQSPGPLTTDSVRTEVAKLRQMAGSNKNHLFYYATDKLENFACFDAKAGKYYFQEQEGTQWVMREQALVANRGRIEELWATAHGLEPDFRAVLNGTHSSLDLRDVTPTGNSLVKTFYETCIQLGGQSGLTDAEKQYATKFSKLGLCARYYAQIVKKFFEANTTLVSQANQELAAVPFSGKTAAELSSASFKRKGMLDYIASLGVKLSALEAVHQPVGKLRQLHSELTMRIRDFENIPQNWL